VKAKVSKQEIVEAGKRVAESSKKILEKVVIDVVGEVLNQALKIAASTMILDPMVLNKLAEKGITDPDDELVMDVIEEVYGDNVNIDESFNNAPQHLQITVNSIIVLARRLGKKEWFEKLTYENVLEQARKRKLDDIVRFMTRYPKLSRKVIEWLRNRVLQATG